MHKIFSKEGVTLKFGVYQRFCLVKIKSVLANIGLEKQVKVKKLISLQQNLLSLEKNNHFWQTQPFWKKVRLNFYEKRSCKCVRIHEVWYSSPPVRICKHFGWPPSIPLVKYIDYFSTKRLIRTFAYRIHWNINIRKKKLFTKK